MFHKSIALLGVLGSAGILISGPAFAANGLNALGFGVESSTMAGTDIAVARDPSALNTNPAGLAQLTRARLDNHAGFAYALDIRHQDMFGNDAEIDNDRVLLGDFGYANPTVVDGMVVGIGMFGQGGAGYDYGKLRTAFGTEDDLSTMFRIAKFIVGAAKPIGNDLAVGASVSVIYADNNQKVFPETSVNAGAQSFHGFEVRDAVATNYGFRLGLQYDPAPSVTLAATYANRVALDMEGGTFVANYSSLGLGKVTYRDLRLTGLHLPREVGVGLALRPNDAWLLAFEMTWLEWSKAVNRATLFASDPDNSGAPPTVELTGEHNWRDQYVWSVGLAYEPTSRSVFRFGYNYGANPIPDENLSPLLPQFAEHHVGLGAGYEFDHQWRIDSGIEYQVKKSVTYTNPNAPFGSNARQTIEYVALHLALSRQW